MAWGPNISAAIFLAREVMPALLEDIPDVRLRIVGRSPVPEVKALGRLPGVEVAGDVPDTKPHLRAARVLAVPLDSGGGTRLKILEAFAAGVPVVSTAIGCEGIEVVHGEHLIIAERDQFVDGLRAALDDTGLGDRLAARARELARNRYDWRIVGRVCLRDGRGRHPFGWRQPDPIGLNDPSCDRPKTARAARLNNGGGQVLAQ